MSLYESILRPVLFRFDSEKVHETGLSALRLALSSRSARNAVARKYRVDGFGELKRFGVKFDNPIGLAAGFDKNAVAFRQLAALGFGFVEVGTVTQRPQPGNPKPRLFRLPLDKAIINRLGFNNEGSVRAVERLKSNDRGCVIGVNIGRNKDVSQENAVGNYLECFENVYESADYITVNVSSPNTPGLRELQDAQRLRELLDALTTKGGELGTKFGSRPMLLKIAPDLSDEAVDAVVGICLEYRISGLIATNTTIERRSLTTAKTLVDLAGEGGLSGRPLAERSTQVISRAYRASGGRLPIIGVGGIFGPEDAFEKIAAGACLLQGYTGFVYSGPAYARDINRGLLRILDEKGFGSLDEAVGSSL